ncbi:DNA methylase [Candidatus Woesearchaeota archaeon]|nr:DNA methylase [Candidatus Woesearchaeota archaeon]|tara:strand:+ start:24489 stop:25100 length:612 start_codon:yes stop_codon:yes gene_type:complete
MITKSKLAIQLSKLKVFSKPELHSEQYTTDSEIAADFLWLAYMNGDIKNKKIADLGCGTGILGIGCLLLDAKKIYFVDNDEEALATAAVNIGDLNIKSDSYEIINNDVNEIKLKADVVIQNPPFGTKQKHADKQFLLKAFETANIIYSIHKVTSIDFIDKLSKSKNFEITHLLRYNLPIKHTHSFHKRKIHRIEVACFRIVKS